MPSVHSLGLSSLPRSPPIPPAEAGLSAGANLSLSPFPGTESSGFWHPGPGLSQETVIVQEEGPWVTQQVRQCCHTTQISRIATRVWSPHPTHSPACLAHHFLLL